MALIETERLRLRPAGPANLDELHQLWTGPEVRRYLMDDVIMPREWTAQQLERSRDSFASSGFGLWLAYDKTSEERAGFGGYWWFDQPPGLQLIYALAPQHWGRGLATELARALLRYGVERCGFERIVASADAPNQASLRVMQRAGMRFAEQTSDDTPTVYYALERADFQPDQRLYRITSFEF